MKIIILIIAILLTSSSAFADEQKQQGNNHVFTNSDLKKSNHSSVPHNQRPNDRMIRATAGASEASLKPAAVSHDKKPKKPLKQ
jgi:hypothetical protein